MLTKAALLLLVLQASPVLPVTSGSQRDENLDAKLRTSVYSYHLQANNFVEALTRVASDFRIPMGIEWVDTPAARARVSLSWKNATVLEVLEAIVKTQAGFQILVGKSVVHVSCSEFVPDRQNPLKLNISQFEVHNVPAELASRQLHEAVARTLFPPKPQQGIGVGIVGSGATNVDDPKISVTLKSATVEDVLDALALASARKIWIVTFSDARTLTAAGYRRTVGLWNRSPIPDDEQPAWDLFHWGDQLPSPTAAT